MSSSIFEEYERKSKALKKKEDNIVEKKRN